MGARSITTVETRGRPIPDIITRAPLGGRNGAPPSRAPLHTSHVPARGPPSIMARPQPWQTLLPPFLAPLARPVRTLRAAYDVGAHSERPGVTLRASCPRPGRGVTKGLMSAPARGTLVIAMCNQARMATVLPRTRLPWPAAIRRVRARAAHTRGRGPLQTGHFRRLRTAVRDVVTWNGGAGVWDEARTQLSVRATWGTLLWPTTGIADIFAWQK